MNAIDIDHVTKVYRRYARRRQFATLKSALLTGTIVRDLRPDETFAAVRDVSFQVKAGCTFGVVGRNGSGKSTMLKLVAGITKPTEGRVHVQGRVSALIELGAGFHPEISGRENVFINGIMLGLTKREIARRFDEIVEFADLRDFIDAPVKTYSSGMYMRLGFAVAIHVDPDVLLIDEVLAVGDEAFTHKCLDKFAEFRRRGKTILLVTHSLGLVERFCDEALWLDAGQARGTGDPRRVVAQYITDVARTEERQLAAGDAKAQQMAAAADTPVPEASRPAEPAVPGDQALTNMFQATEGRWGSREVEITDVVLVGEDGQPGHIFESGERVEIRLKVRAVKPTRDFVFGIGLFTAEAVLIHGTNTGLEEYQPDELAGEGEARIVIDRLDLVEGTYKLDVAVHKLDGYPYDYHRLLYSFRVKSYTKDVGIYRPAHRWSFSPGIKFIAAAPGSAPVPGDEAARGAGVPASEELGGVQGPPPIKQ
jgi:ABC-type polysaccharide/polyol phosphate transport system ATPase subunit